MRISDWSSDVCSSDLTLVQFERGCVAINRGGNPSWRRNLLCFVAPCVRASGAAGGHRTARCPPWCSGLTCFYPTLQSLGGAPAWCGGWQRRTPCESLVRSEEHTSELQSIMRISYAVFCLKKKNVHKKKK